MKKLLGLAALAAVVALPSASLAATYAYVNTSGEVTSMEADSAATALATAPNMDIHSGVMLLTGSNNNVVGTSGF